MMDTTPSSDDRVKRLADDISRMILAKRALLEQVEGRITVEVFPRGAGYDLRMNIRTR